MKNKRFIKISSTIICLLIIMIVCYILIPKGISNDMFFDIRTGKDILKYGIDFKDHFSFIPNLTYIYHHYLFDIIVYEVYNLFSYFGLSIMFTIISTIFGFTVFYVCKKYSKSNILSLIVFVVSMYLTRWMFNTRVQTITYLLFYLQLYFTEQLYTKKEKKYSILILINSILIANLHMPLWIFSVILYLPFLVESLIASLSNKIKGLTIFKAEKTTKIVVITFILLLFAGLLTPLKMYPYTFFLKSLNNDTYLAINEMQKTQLFYEMQVVLILIFFVISVYLNVLKIKLRDLILIVGLFVFSLIAKRNVVYFYIFVPTIYIKSLNMKCYFNSKKIHNIINKINLKIVNIVVIAGLTTIYVLLIHNFNYNKYDYDLNEYPVKTVEYIKNNLDYKNIKLYNDFNYGSYLLFNDIPVFVDSRAEVYIKEYNNSADIFNDYISTWDYIKYKKIFNKYQFDYAIVYKNSTTYNYLKADSDFEIVYKEEYYVLFKRIS